MPCLNNKHSNIHAHLITNYVHVHELKSLATGWSITPSYSGLQPSAMPIRLRERYRSTARLATPDHGHNPRRQPRHSAFFFAAFHCISRSCSPISLQTDFTLLEDARHKNKLFVRLQYVLYLSQYSTRFELACECRIVRLAPPTTGEID